MAKCINLYGVNEELFKIGAIHYKDAGAGDRVAKDVFVKRCKESNALIAAKIISMDKKNDSELEHLNSGIRVTRMLKHKNLLPYLAVFVEVNDLWILSPFYDLGSASDLCKPTGIDDEICLAYLLRDVLMALEYLHQRGIIHRAVRGSHILMKHDGRCALSGLQYCTSMIKDGTWKTAIHEFPSNATSNLNWLSPEVLEQNLLGYNSKSDIYSLGITCCELANGVVPFDNLHPTEMLLDKLTGNYPKPLDASCAHFIHLPEEGMTDEDREKYKVYESRRFSELFQSFTVSLCLVSDPHKRPTATALLKHGFIKQLKKAAPASCVFADLAKRKTKTGVGVSGYSDEGVSSGTSEDDSNQFTWNFP